MEFSAADLPGALAGAGIRDMKVWHSTFSGVIVRHRKGDTLIDTGLSPNALAEVDELPQAERTFGQGIVNSAKNRMSVAEALAQAGEQPDQVSAIIVTHAHYDHIGGATTLSAPIVVSAPERTWIAAQSRAPTIVPPTMSARLSPRLTTVSYNSGPFMGFERSKDYYGDGSVVLVPMPGHTPGSQGVFLTVGKRRVFLIGDATDTLEAAYRGLPKAGPIRTATDFEPRLADEEAKRIAAFHKAYPDVAIVPAHDRTAYITVFGKPGGCVSPRG